MTSLTPNECESDSHRYLNHVTFLLLGFQEITWSGEVNGKNGIP